MFHIHFLHLADSMKHMFLLYVFIIRYTQVCAVLQAVILKFPEIRFIVTVSATNEMLWNNKSSFITSLDLIDLFRPRLLVSSEVFQVAFVHLFYNSTLFLAPFCCSFLLHVVVNWICIFLDSRQLILLSAVPEVLHCFVNVRKIASFCSSENLHLECCQ